MQSPEVLMEVIGYMSRLLFSSHLPNGMQHYLLSSFCRSWEAARCRPVRPGRGRGRAGAPPTRRRTRRRPPAPVARVPMCACLEEPTPTPRRPPRFVRMPVFEGLTSRSTA